MNDTFTLVRKQFAEQCFEHWASTDPKNLKEREHIFTKCNALQDFVGHLKAYVIEKDKIEKRELSKDPYEEFEDATTETD